MSTNLLLKSLCLQNRTSQYYYVKCNCPTRNVEVSYVVFDQSLAWLHCTIDTFLSLRGVENDVEIEVEMVEV